LANSAISTKAATALNFELSIRGNIVPALAAHKRFPGLEGATDYNFDILKNPNNDWLVAEHQNCFNAPTAGGFEAEMATVAAVEGEIERHGESLSHDAGHGARYAQGQDDFAQGGPSGAAVNVRIQHQPECRVGYPRAHAGAQDRAQGHPDR
jgi:hypothetical protein